MTELFAADGRFLAIVLRTLVVSGTATAMAVFIGFPLGYGIARRNFRGRTLLLGFINTGMGTRGRISRCTWFGITTQAQS